MKSLSTFITEGTDLHCHNCGDNLGKATENSKKAYCGTCGSTTHNPKGDDDSTPVKKKSSDGDLPNIKMTKHTPAVNPSGKAFTVKKDALRDHDAHHVSHGNGLFTATTKYADHPDYGHLGVKVAHTSIYKISSDGYKGNIGKIDHTKHPDGSETHSLTYRPSNGSWSGGDVKSLKDAVSKVDAMHTTHLKKTGYFNKEKHDHGHGVKFWAREHGVESD